MQNQKGLGQGRPLLNNPKATQKGLICLLHETTENSIKMILSYFHNVHDMQEYITNVCIYIYVYVYLLHIRKNNPIENWENNRHM